MFKFITVMIHHFASNITLPTCPVCSWCYCGGQPQPFDQCSNTDGHLPDWSYCRNHRPGVAGSFSSPHFNHLQEEAEGQGAHHASRDLLPTYEGHCRLHHCRYNTVWPVSNMFCIIFHITCAMLGNFTTQLHSA